jgi:4-diphosphocytidyl-2C-methyl-D-erythritol kinase
MRLCPAVGRIREALLAAGARVAAVTGSGSAVFGVFADAGAAREAVGILDREGIRAQACATLDRASFQRERFEH